MFITNSTLLQKRWQAPGRPNILCDQRLPSRRERRKAAAIHQNCVWAARSRPGSSERATNRVCSPSELLSGKNTDLGKKGDFRALQVGQHTFGRSFKTLLELPLGPKFSWHVQCAVPRTGFTTSWCRTRHQGGNRRAHAPETGTISP